MSDLRKKLIIFAALLLALCLAFGAGLWLSPVPAPVIIQQATELQETAEALSQVDEFAQERKELLAENDELKERLKELKAKPEKIIYLETLVPGREETLPAFPDSYLYKTQDGLSVAAHQLTPDGFEVKVYDIKIHHDVVVSRVKNGPEVVHVTTLVSTSANDLTVPYQSEVEFHQAKEKEKVFWRKEIAVTAAKSLSDQSYDLEAEALTGIEYRRVYLMAGLQADRLEIKPALKVGIKW